MAHKGKLWPVAQDARLWSGGYNWPNYLAKDYTYFSDGWEGSAGHPTVASEINLHFDGIEDTNKVVWRSDDLGPSPQTTIIRFRVFIESFDPSSTHYDFQLTVNGVDQFTDGQADFFRDQNEVFAFVMSYTNVVPGWVLLPTGVVGWVAKPW